MSKRVRKALTKRKAFKHTSSRILMSALKYTRQKITAEELVKEVQVFIQFLEDHGFLTRSDVTRKP